ncbi:uncharacterized protein LOC142768281 [Rhipicephalus microplus]|uniref:uncharacterized protein LOC142768281 n=1 Tax=Rhipicephalus microplus TaxID=6941 RepID=UPI003F6B474B
MDFLTEHRAIIDLQSRQITLSTGQNMQSKATLGRHAILRVLDEEVSVPRRASVIIPVVTVSTEDVEGVIEGNRQFFLHRQLRVARCIAYFKNGQADVLVTNFGRELRHLNKGSTIGFLDEVGDIPGTFAISDQFHRDSSMQNQPPVFDINPEFPSDGQNQIRILLESYGHCFATSSKVPKTPIAMHRIITSEHARSLRQSPYRVSPREREAIRKQVDEMLRDDIIQPSKSPWATPVVLVKKKVEASGSASTIVG